MYEQVGLDKNTPPHSAVEFANNQQKSVRSSNLELYRILCMVMIVAHHYVVHSGIVATDGPLVIGPVTIKSLFLLVLGAWGKTGINCFMMITGYFMCTSKISLRKFLKLMGQIYLYKLLLFPIFLMAGYETFSPVRLIKLLMPFWGFSDGFTSCFIAFWLTIPFLSILVQNMTKRQHELLLILVLGLYTVCGSIPTFNITFNYITWFCIIFFISSYIRLYPRPVFLRKSLWGWLSLVSVLFAVVSIIGLKLLFGERVGIGYFFVHDCNKIFAVAIAVFSFLWFKNMNIRYNKVINAFGAGTFGVLLIHSNSQAMRNWLWDDLVDLTGHYTLPSSQLALYSLGVVLAIFIVCNLIDQLRIATVEKWFLDWYDKKLSSRADRLVNRLLIKE